MNVLILIPTYNEAENIGRLLDDLNVITKRAKKHKFTILVVDDKSPDGTGDIVKQHRKKCKSVNLLQGEKKGLGKAMIRGYIYAMRKFAPDVIVTNEADFGFDFKHLPYMLKKIEEGYDVVLASRHVGEGGSEGWTLSRRLNHWVANTFFAAWIAGVNEVGDHNGAFRAIRVRGVLDSVDIKNFKVTGFGFFFYLVYRLTLVTDKIDEFPTTFTFRIAGESKVSFNTKYIATYMKDIFEYASLAFKIRLKIV